MRAYEIAGNVVDLDAVICVGRIQSRTITGSTFYTDYCFDVLFNERDRITVWFTEEQGDGGWADLIKAWKGESK